MSFFHTILLHTVFYFFSGAAHAGTIVEDFTSFTHADFQHSTAIWNTVNHSAHSRAYADGVNGATRPIDFGDGSDGVVNSSNGYTFNTDSHPNGYNFKSLNITAGAITVTGTHPLIIRSLSTINIIPDLKVNGANGNNGSLTGISTPGPAAKTCLSNGGNGGAATGTTASPGGDGIQSDGTTEGGTQGLGELAPVNDANIDGQSSTAANPSSNDFETATNFVCGISGAGGGGYQHDLTTFASGGAGGAGGGIIKIVSLGDLTLGGAIEAKGGNGGNGVLVATGPDVCSGNGSGGRGGAIFLQTLGTLSTFSDPDVTEGNSGSICSRGSGPSFSGYVRGDSVSTGHPAWGLPPSIDPINYDTENVPFSDTSFVQSTAYDLGTLNAGFSTPTLNTTPGTGAVSVTYAGSTDGTTFSSFTSDISTLSNLNYRFLKFRVNFTNSAVDHVAPKITLVSIPFSELGLAKLDVKLSPGCGTLNRVDSNRPSNSDFAGALLTSIWFLFWVTLFRLSKKLRIGSNRTSSC